jgi:hypothetical protein
VWANGEGGGIDGESLGALPTTRHPGKRALPYAATRTLKFDRFVHHSICLGLVWNSCSGIWGVLSRVVYAGRFDVVGVVCEQRGKMDPVFNDFLSMRTPGGHNLAI